MRKPALLFVITLASLLVLPAAADSSVAGNGFFQVIVEDTAGADGLGAFSLRTGPNHPAGGGHDVLFSGASAQDAASSYLTVRSYTTGTDYVQTTRGAASAYLVAPLDALATMEPIGSTGFRTTYVLPGFGDAPDSLRIVSEIEAAGFTTIIQAWDFRPGENFVVQMQRAASEAERTVLVLTEDYLKSAFALAEWTAAFAQDPMGTGGRLVPVRVKACEPGGLLRAIVFIDLVGLDETTSRERLR